MIITVTCNPAIDKTVYENKTVFDIGGKGINVSKALKELGAESIATGFVGKENKDLVINDLNKNGIKNHFIEVDGSVRTNTKKILNNNLIEENEDGPYIDQKYIDALFEYLKQFKNEIVIISGSVPSSVDNNIYKNLIYMLKRNDNYVILDCSGELFKNAIEAKPNIIKPNKKEISEFFNTEYDEDIIVDKCKKLGIDLVCLSLGKDGAVFIDDEINKSNALEVNYKSAVGAGDSMVAALAYCKINNFDKEKTIKFVMAASAAACETEGTKPPKYEDIICKLKKI